jgi:peptidoglycan hydrolase-like protein with peptidoglycan-binding domain
MRVLKLGVSGEDVRKWQEFLKQRNFYRGSIDGQFGPETRQATVDFQRFHELRPAEGLVTNPTLGMAMVLGFVLFDEAD